MQKFGGGRGKLCEGWMGADWPTPQTRQYSAIQFLYILSSIREILILTVNIRSTVGMTSNDTIYAVDSTGTILSNTLPAPKEVHWKILPSGQFPKVRHSRGVQNPRPCEISCSSLQGMGTMILSSSKAHTHCSRLRFLEVDFITLCYVHRSQYDCTACWSRH